MDQVFRGFEKASSRDPTHDKVMGRKPDGQGGSGFQGFQKAAPKALTLKMISVFLMPASMDYSLISVTQAEGLPQSLKFRIKVSWVVVYYEIIRGERRVLI